MAEKEVLLTQEGLDKLETELDDLKNVKRREIAGRIKQAIEFGDISENSEYEDAKNEQAMIEGQIVELENKIRNATVIAATGKSNMVSVGSTVKLFNVDKNMEMTFTIVGSTEADPNKLKISNESPVGKSIIGCKVGQTVAVEVPKGVATYKILEIG